MENKISKKYHLPLLLIIPLVVVTGFIMKRSADLQDTYFMIAALPFVLFLSFILGAKAFCYFKTQTYEMNSKLCWTDVGLTLVITSLLLYSGLDGLLGNDFSLNGMIFLNLAIGSWLLIQFMVFIDYFVLMFYGSRK